MPDITGYSHVALTVTDVARSKQWWTDLLGIQELFAGDENGITFSVNMHSSGLIMGFRKHEAGDEARFDESRVGLDHFAIDVGSRAELDKWAARLDELGIEHSGIKDVDYGGVITFRDPDNIQAEFYSLPGT